MRLTDLGKILLALFAFWVATLFLFVSLAHGELRPDPPPACKRVHCHVTTTWAYSYWSTGVWTIDGHKRTVRILCHVDRGGRHTCSVKVPLAR